MLRKASTSLKQELFLICSFFLQPECWLHAPVVAQFLKYQNGSLFQFQLSLYWNHILPPLAFSPELHIFTIGSYYQETRKKGGKMD